MASAVDLLRRQCDLMRPVAMVADMRPLARVTGPALQLGNLPPELTAPERSARTIRLG